MTNIHYPHGYVCEHLHNRLWPNCSWLQSQVQEVFSGVNVDDVSFVAIFIHTGSHSVVAHVHIHMHSCIHHFHMYNRLLVCFTFFLPNWKIFHFHSTLMKNILLSKKELLVIQWKKAAVITHSELSRRLISANGIKWQLKMIASKLSPPSVWHWSFLHVPAHYLVGRGELQLDVIRGSFIRESGRADCLVQCSDW